MKWSHSLIFRLCKSSPLKNSKVLIAFNTPLIGFYRTIFALYLWIFSFLFCFEHFTYCSTLRLRLTQFVNRGGRRTRRRDPRGGSTRGIPPLGLSCLDLRQFFTFFCHQTRLLVDRDSRKLKQSAA